MISQVEHNNQQQSLKILERKVLTLISDKFLLKQTQGNLITTLQQKEAEIQILTDSFANVRSHLMTLNFQTTLINP